MAVSKIVKDASTLTKDDFAECFYKMFDNRGPEEQRALAKNVMKRASRHAKKGIVGECDPPSNPFKPRPCSSRETSVAFNKPFIYRSDLVPENEPVFLDVEKLSLRKSDPKKPHVAVASSLAIVNNNNDLILWSFIKWPEDNICQTFPTITGITKKKLEIGFPLEQTAPFIEQAFVGNLVVGWDLSDDLKSLKTSAAKTFDLTEYFFETRYNEKEAEIRVKYGLKDIYKHFFKKGDSFQCGIHSAIQDARATRDLYFKYLELKEKYPEFSMYSEPIQRSKSKFIPDPNDLQVFQKQKVKTKD